MIVEYLEDCPKAAVGMRFRFGSNTRQNELGLIDHYDKQKVQPSQSATL